MDCLTNDAQGAAPRSEHASNHWASRPSPARTLEELCVPLALLVKLRIELPWALQQKVAALVLERREQLTPAQLAGVTWSLTAQDFHPGARLAWPGLVVCSFFAVGAVLPET